ncbi:MAG: hypothetical protein AB1486_05655 [Planctomycetota bacterium]
MHEADFVIGDMDVALGAKATGHVTSDHLKRLREIRRDHPQLRKRVLVCLEPRARLLEDGILILPATSFAKKLWEGELLA